MRKVATFGLAALSIFLILSCAETPTSVDTSNPGETQGEVSDDGIDPNQDATSTSDDTNVSSQNPSSAEPLSEMELDRAALRASSEVDITYAQEFARNRALASFKKLFPQLIKDLTEPGWIGKEFLWEEAIPRVNEMIEDDPENPEFHLLSGFINFQLNYNEDAIAAFKKTIELDPRNFEAHFYLGIIYYELPKAINYLTQSIELATNPYQISDAFARRALSHCVQELYDECFSDIENALYLAPNNAFAILAHSTIFEDKAKRETEATGKEGIPGVDLGVEP
jgi:tetratricopeptide (TPR) repeat protein